MKFFGLLSLLLAIVGVGFLVPVLLDYFSTGLVLRFPTLIVCCFALLAAVVSLFCGVLLETMTWKNKQDFEMELHRVEEEKKDKVQ